MALRKKPRRKAMANLLGYDRTQRSILVGRHPTTGKENGNIENGMNFFTLFVSSHPCKSSTDSSDNFHE